MLGAIAGDIIGSVHEGSGMKEMNFTFFRKEIRAGDRPRFLGKLVGINNFTDDTVMTLALADAIMNGQDYGPMFKFYGRKYPKRGYGGMFQKWLHQDLLLPYNSYGNGSAMRVSPIGFAFEDLNIVLEEAKKSAEVTHNHPEGIKGAQAIAAAIFLAIQGEGKETIRKYVEETFAYNLQRTIEEIRPEYKFDVTCQGSVPEAILAFLDSTDYENCVRLAISLGGDADTLAAMAGGIAQAYYKKIPSEIVEVSKVILGNELWDFVENFQKQYQIEY